MPTPFSDRLAHAVLGKASRLVVGIDPDLSRIPAELLALETSDPRESAAETLRRFAEAVIEAVADLACAIKLQSACFEAWGAPGVRAYESTILCARGAGVLVIADVKRGDIGTTAEAYARGHVLSAEAADAVTLNPYLGTDSILPFVRAAEQTGRGAFVLVRTSNPSAKELQDLQVDGRPVHVHVAELVDRWAATGAGAAGYSSIGAVVGATAPHELRRLRMAMPRSWFLVPGVGAQGATAADVSCAFDEAGLGAIVNSSRAIIYAFGPPDRPGWRQEIRDAARCLRDELQEVLRTSRS